ncbi:anaerobic magnesium-protoporphyrin IX monomethyl ester cyclase [Lachnospiraceae bacterium PM6-15]|uniref:B12-binding domain-containing radical SAM protein n=1 Tax=Ohessyouella blattaphilus TaxID=2949333 RepID=UPI003E203596
MNILFTAFPSELRTDIDNISYRTVPTTAIYLLGAVLREEGFNVRIMDPQQILTELKVNSLEDILLNQLENIDVICVSANTINWAASGKGIEIIRKKCARSIKIVVGGLHPTYFYEHIISKYDIDYLMVGEGEKTIGMLMRSIQMQEDASGIPGVVVKEKYDGKKIIPAPIISNEDFSQLPLPIFEDLPPKSYLALPIETSRGCKYGCKFCSVAYRKSWRDFSAKHVKKRARNTINNYSELFLSKEIFVTDDCLTANLSRAMDIAEELFSIDESLRFAFETRITDWQQKERKEAAQVFSVKQVGRLGFGIECGYDEGLKKISKGLTIETLESTLRFLEASKMIDKAYFSFIIGFPWETLDGCLSTINYAADIVKRYGNGIVNLNWLRLYPSEIWDQRASYNIELNEEVFDDLDYNRDKFFSSAHPSISLEEVRYISYIIQEYESRGIFLRNF